jgi:hypothetical protein
MAGGKANAYTPDTPSYRILNNPTTGDEFGFRNALHDYAQGRSDRIFGSLATLLGGSAPQINFVPTGSQFAANHMSANISDSVGAPLGTINADPLAVDAFIEDDSPIHSGVVNQFPHEMAHTRQTPQVLADVPTREGGAQAFADYVTQAAAKRANVPYLPNSFDGGYDAYEKQAQARGLAWLLAGQFGKPGSPTFP